MYIFLVLHTTLGTLWPHSGRDGWEAIKYLLPFFLSKSTPISLGNNSVPAQIQTQFLRLSWSLQQSVESVGKIFPAKILNRKELASMHTFTLAFTLLPAQKDFMKVGVEERPCDHEGKNLRWRGDMGPDESWILDQLFLTFLCKGKWTLFIYTLARWPHLTEPVKERFTVTFMETSIRPEAWWGYCKWKWQMMPGR